MHRYRMDKYGQLDIPDKPVRRKAGEGCIVNGYVVVAGRGQHRIVMEEMLGRPLVPGETVHHINGVKDDNRPENLELWVSHQPSGQRPQDLLEWADEIIARYRDGKA